MFDKYLLGGKQLVGKAKMLFLLSLLFTFVPSLSLAGENLIDHMTGKASIPSRWDPVDEQWHEDRSQVSTYTANLAWTMIALLNYYKKMGGNEYLSASIKLGEWIEREEKDARFAGGYISGYKGWEPDPQKLLWKSTVHNIDLYVAFKLLYEITKDTKWNERALHARTFVNVEAMLNDADEYFWTAVLEDGCAISLSNIPPDIQAWADIALDSYASALVWAENNCYTEANTKPCLVLDAVRCGDLYALKALIEAGADIDCRGDEERTALDWAASKGHTNIVKLLLGKDANVDVKDRHGNTPLHSAAQKGHMQVARELLAALADVKVKNDNGQMSITLAHLAGHTELAELLRNVAFSRKRDHQGRTPLHFKASAGEPEQVERLITMMYVDVNARDEDGNTPLHLAAGEGRTQVVEILIAKGADLNVKKKWGTFRHITAGLPCTCQ